MSRSLANHFEVEGIAMRAQAVASPARAPRIRKGQRREDGLTATVFSTALGAMGVVESPRGLVTVRIGFADEDSLRRRLQHEFPGAAFRAKSQVAELLRRYAKGERVCFDGVTLDDRGLTPFRRRVVGALRKVGFGRTVTYAQLADAAGSRGASRAVGGTMASNPWPIVVPCHRVLRSDGRLGGFSAPGGVPLKRRMLDLERAG
jgi:methylated-DNA-[protein]-cysteine S-methyltransferase